MNKVKFALIALTVGAMAQLGGCSAGNIMRLLGDIAGDALWLGVID